MMKRHILRTVGVFIAAQVVLPIGILIVGTVAGLFLFGVAEYYGGLAGIQTLGGILR